MSEVWQPRQRTRVLALDAAVALLFAIYAVATSIGLGTGALAVAALLTLALLMRRTSTLVMVLAGVLGGVIQLATLVVTYGPDVAYLAIFFTLGAHRDRRWRTVGLAGAAAAVVSAGLINYFYRQAATGTAPLWITSLMFAALAAVFALGGWVAGYLRLVNQRAVESRFESQMATVEQLRLREAVEAERERAAIATDMHDVVAHSLAVVAAQADGARYALRSDPDAAEQSLSQIGDTARVAIGDLRTILARLRDPAAPPPAPGEDQQSALLDRMRAAGMELIVREQGQRSTSPLLALTAHRLLGEALTNALKHGDLSHPVTVDVNWTHGYALRVTNVVRQGDSPPMLPGTGHGVTGMRERATLAGGSLSASLDGATWVVTADIPTPHQGTEA